MVTTIQLKEEVKVMLSKMKKGNETYEDVIVSLIQNSKTNNNLLKEGYIEMAYETEGINKEWSNVEKTWD